MAVRQHCDIMRGKGARHLPLHLTLRVDDRDMIFALRDDSVRNRLIGGEHRGGETAASSKQTQEREGGGESGVPHGNFPSMWEPRWADPVSADGPRRSGLKKAYCYRVSFSPLRAFSSCGPRGEYKPAA